MTAVLIAVTLGMGSFVLDTNERLGKLEYQMALLVTQNNEIISSPTNALERAKLQAEIDLINLEIEHIKQLINDFKNK